MIGPSPDFTWLISRFTNLIQITIPVVAALALLVFFWGLVKFIYNVSGDTKAVAEGKKLMVWGLIALFLMVSVWGIISFLSNEFDFGGQLFLPLLPEPSK